MTAQTQSQRNASYRQRQRQKIARMEGALREIADHGSDMGVLVCERQAKRALGEIA